MLTGIVPKLLTQQNRYFIFGELSLSRLVTIIIVPSVQSSKIEVTWWVLLQYVPSLSSTHPHAHLYIYTRVFVHTYTLSLTQTQPQSSGSEEPRREEPRREEVNGGESSGTDDKKVDVPDPNEPSGFARGLVPEEILGATEMEGRILFLMKW